MNRRRRVYLRWGPCLAIVLALTFLPSCGRDDPVSPEPPDTPALKIGLLINMTGSGAEQGIPMRRGFELAIDHINGEGVLGKPVEGLVADTRLDAEVAVSEARRLTEQEGVHAIVGARASSLTLAIIEDVAVAARVPIVSPASSSPLLTDAPDYDFLFRTTPSDRVEGPVLAQIIREQGFDNVGLIYRDDVWGRGITGSFEEAWAGKLVRVAADPSKTTFLAELRESAREGAQVLVVLAFQPNQETMVREALEEGLYERFFFGATGRSLALVRSIGAERLAGMYGTSPGTARGTASARAWENAYRNAHGEPPPFPYAKQTYDATVAIALAAQAAGSVDGDAIRDRLRAVGRPPGEVVNAEAGSIAKGLRVLAGGGEVDYEGAATTLDWDTNGDLATGFVAVWRFTEAATIEEVRVVPFVH